MRKEISLTETALIVPGHGSTEDRQSSQATRDLVEELRQRGVFGEVYATFWKEEPHYREVFDSISCSDVYVVPHFISEGYFTQEVIPRELELDGRMTQRDGFCIRYCDPVGSHPGMTDLLVQLRAQPQSPVAPAETSVLVLGHGTGRNANSAKAVSEQVKKIQIQAKDFGEVQAVYLDESPRLSNWHQLTKFQNVVVLPHFIAEGLHFNRDLPEMMGIDDNTSEQPFDIRSRKVYYTQPVGVDPAMADFVIDQVKGFESE